MGAEERICQHAVRTGHHGGREQTNSACMLGVPVCFVHSIIQRECVLPGVPLQTQPYPNIFITVVKKNYNLQNVLAVDPSNK